VAQKIHIGRGENALLQIDNQAVVLKTLEWQLQMLQMFLVGRTGDDDVVQIRKAEVKARGDPVHQQLERVARVPKAKKHAEELEQPEWCRDGCRGDVGRVHW
jgi:hypothetical protein